MLAEQLRAAKDPDVPAVAVAIVGADGVRASAAAGVADLARGTPASSDMVCPWFSMTKIVTATAAMRLHEQGVLDLDLPIASLVPAVGRMRPSDDAARITSRHLLSHSSGIANPIPVSWIHRPEEPAPDLGAFVDEQLRKHPKLRSRPGAAASYSNVGFLVLGLAMERAASTPFTDLIEREVLRPLGMARTGFSLPSDRLRATGYHPRWSPLRYLLPRWVVGDRVERWRSLRPFLVDGAPYGGLVGSVEGAAPFVRMHLRDGELDGVRILGGDAAREMREIRTRGKRYDLGLGWFRPAKERDADPPFVEHLGGGAGFYNVMRIYPTRGVGVVVMGNVTRYDIDAIAALALEDVG
jgi:CubicO group peptidase (beta-lactamase class C family)